MSECSVQTLKWGATWPSHQTYPPLSSCLRRCAMRGSRVVVLSYASLVMMVLRFVVQYYRVGLRSFRGSIQRTVYPAALMASLTSPMVTLP